MNQAYRARDLAWLPCNVAAYLVWHLPFQVTNNGLCLSPPDEGAITPQKQILAWCDGSNAQLWFSEPWGLLNYAAGFDGASGHSLCLDAPGQYAGLQLDDQYCDLSPAQDWHGFMAPASASGGGGRADPSAIRVDSTYYSVESDGRNILSRSASSAAGLSDGASAVIWSDPGMGEIWAPELTRIGGRCYVYFAAGSGSAHRMYAISADSPAGGYGAAQQVALPDDKWAIDGAAFTLDAGGPGGNDQLWFVWSGWDGDTNVEQNIYIARMWNGASAQGPRYVISQPRESWERVVGSPFINDAPEPIKDPNGQPCTSCSRPTVRGATSTAWRTYGCGPAATRLTCGTGASPMVACSAPTATP